MNEILARVRELDSYRRALDAFKKGTGPFKLGLIRSARLVAAAALSEDLKRNAVLLSHRRDRAINYFDELELWTRDTEALYFPEPSSLFYEKAPWSETARRERLNSFARASTQSEAAKTLIFEHLSARLNGQEHASQ